MNRKTVFISSVQSEFAKERKLLADYIRQDALFSMYFEPFLFEELPAQDRSAQTAYLEQAANAGVYLLLMGGKYGYEDNEGISPYRAGIQYGHLKPRLSFGFYQGIRTSRA